MRLDPCTGPGRFWMGEISFRPALGLPRIAPPEEPLMKMPVVEAAHFEERVLAARSTPQICVKLLAVRCHHVGNNLSHERGAGTFFDNTSCRTALSRLSSATSVKSATRTKGTDSSMHRSIRTGQSRPYTRKKSDGSKELTFCR